MNLTSTFDFIRRRGWLTGLAMLGLVASAAGELPKDGSVRRPAGRGLTLATTPNQEVMDRNRLIFLLQDNGEIGSSGSSVAGGGFWIATTNQYVFSSGPNVGAVVGNDTLVAIGGPFSELEAGGPTFDALVLDEFYSTTNPEDIGNFPDVCTVDDFRLQQFPSLQPFSGEPFPGFADQTVCVAANDIQAGTCGDCGGTRLGVEIVSTLFAFGVPLVQDFVFVAFRIFNSSEFVTAANTPAVAAGTQVAGPYDFEGTVVSIAIDPDIGDAGDDQVAFLPEVQTMVFWDSDFTEPQFQGTPGFGGISYLKTPIDPATGEEVGLAEFTLFTNGNPRPDPQSKEEWYRAMTGDLSFVVLEVSPRDVRGMASSGRFPLPADGFVEIYAAYFFAPVAGAPPTQLLAEAYKNLTTGVINPDANDDPAFEAFKTTQLTAQATFDAGFVVPTSPPKPDFTLIPGDMQVTIVWDAIPVEFVNPFAKVALDPFARLPSGQPDPDAPPITDDEGNPVTVDADQVIFVPSRDVGGTSGFVTAGEAGLTGAEVTNAAFDPNFVIQDFQGFRVYRSRTGLTSDAELIAQVDLDDAITGGLFCFDAEPVFSAGELVTTICTDVQEAAIGTNTGLSFAIVDRGGTFPDPSNGPGLINGIPVFYTVTSFAVNIGQSPILLPDEVLAAISEATPAAPLILESGLAPLRETTPRSDASSFQASVVGDAQLIGGDGEPLPRGDDALPLDPDTGLLTGPIPPANDFDVSVTVIDGTLIPEGFEARVVIDSVHVGFEFFGVSFDDFVVGAGTPAFNMLPAVDARGRIYYYHIEDGDGNILQMRQGADVVPAVAAAFTGFLAFEGSAPFTSQSLTIVSPNDPTQVAFTIQWSSAAGERATQCARVVNCEVLTGAGGGVPASIANFDWEVGAYGQVAYRDIEITWGTENGALTLTSARDITHNVDLPFEDFFGTEGWGFASETGLGAAEEALIDVLELTGLIPRTADGDVLYGDPYWTAVNGQNFSFGGASQGAPHWTDLPFIPDIFTLLAPHSSTFTGDFPQRGALSPTAALYTCPTAGGSFACAGAGAGQQGTRLWISANWLDLAFNQLPADGETWLIRLPNGVATAPRPPVPGTSLAVSVSTSTNELAEADLSEILVVPNPFIAANEITRGRGIQRLLFTNLPPQATIRIYTISGNLVRVLEHSDGSGTEPWDVRTRFDLLVASGNYYYHVTTPDGRTHLGRFAVIN